MFSGSVYIVDVRRRLRFWQVVPRSRCLGPRVEEVAATMTTPQQHAAEDAGGGTRKKRLSREIVLEAALKLVDEEGLEALTMRRLGQALDRDPMGLYRYAANRAALLDGVTELVLNELAIFGDDPDWQGETRRIDAALLRDHLGADLGSFTYLVAGPPKMVEAVEEILSGEGVPKDKIRPERFSGY